MKALLACTYLFITLNFITDTNAATIYLIRHAEKETSDKSDSDPDLTPAGITRAKLAGQILSEIQFTTIYSTDYSRTRQTAEFITLNQPNQEIIYYDPRKLAKFAEMLKTQPADGVFLVVGHSNTTPQLAQMLSNQPIAAMDESEYHHLFRVGINPDGSTSFDALSIPPIPNNDE